MSWVRGREGVSEDANRTLNVRLEQVKRAFAVPFGRSWIGELSRGDQRRLVMARISALAVGDLVMGDREEPRAERARRFLRPDREPGQSSKCIREYLLGGILRLRPGVDPVVAIVQN